MQYNRKRDIGTPQKGMLEDPIFNRVGNTSLASPVSITLYMLEHIVTAQTKYSASPAAEDPGTEQQ